MVTGVAQVRPTRNDAGAGIGGAGPGLDVGAAVADAECDGTDLTLDVVTGAAADGATVDDGLAPSGAGVAHAVTSTAASNEDIITSETMSLRREERSPRP